MTGAAMLSAAALVLSQDPVPVVVVEPLVYFGFDSTEPTADSSPGLEAIDRFAPSTLCFRIRASADTAGPAAYNLDLSRRRAQVIAGRLMAAGVDADRISLNPTGETRLARPTADGVAEPLNRLVWVDIWPCGQT